MIPPSLPSVLWEHFHLEDNLPHGYECSNPGEAEKKSSIGYYSLQGNNSACTPCPVCSCRTVAICQKNPDIIPILSQYCWGSRWIIWSPNSSSTCWNFKWLNIEPLGRYCCLWIPGCINIAMITCRTCFGKQRIILSLFESQFVSRSSTFGVEGFKLREYKKDKHNLSYSHLTITKPLKIYNLNGSYHFLCHDPTVVWCNQELFWRILALYFKLLGHSTT